jgi:hypothetical protein
MVDRVSLIKALEPCVKPTSTQAEAMRKALDKALTETVMSLPLTAVDGLSSTVRSDLEVVLRSLDQKLAEKLAASWEPKRKLDAELKRSAKKDLIDLLHRRRASYEPISVSLEEARAEDTAVYRATIEHVAPVKDLKTLLTKWDKDFKPAPTTRSGFVKRLSELLNGAPPTKKTGRR